MENVTSELLNMPKTAITPSERETITKLQRAALGYKPLRMKPVHLATSFLVALMGRYRKLQWLNIVANPKVAEKKPGDLYVSDNLYGELIGGDTDFIGKGVSAQDLKILRQHLNAAFNNDGAALAPCYPPYSTFGVDYSTPSLNYLANQSKNHGNAGAFMWLVFNESAVGKRFLLLAADIVASSLTSASVLGQPLVEEEEQTLVDDCSDLCGQPSLSFLKSVSDLMLPQTEVLTRLAEHLGASKSIYALRNLVLGVGSWLLTYQVRHIPGSAESVLFCDFAGDTHPRLRAQSAACYSRHLGLFGRSLKLWLDLPSTSVSDQEAALCDQEEARVSKDLEDHFRDFSVRIGWAQPRSGTSQKYFRPQPDTMRVLLMSVLEEGEICTMDDIAERLGQRWGLVFGLLPSDHAVLRRHGYSPLDEDADLRANREAFKNLATSLGLAWEPSDGLVLFSLTKDRLV
jgi:hypothetical protein